MNRRTACKTTLAIGASIAVMIGGTGCGLTGVASPSTVSAPVPTVVVSSSPRVSSLSEALKTRRGEDRGFVDLASAYLQRARDNGDPSYYPKVEALVTSALQKNPQDPDALTLMGMLSLSRHQFEDALVWGEKARAANPDSTQSLGVIGDAQIETGKYDAAVTTIQTMVDQRPDLSSYARVSYLRELNGEVPGAIQAMEQAIEAGGAVPENIAYPKVILGNLYFDSGNLAEADSAYTSALAVFPNYVHAEAGLAKVQSARGNYSEAIKLYREAVDRYPSPEYVIALGDTYDASGDLKSANESYDLAAAEQKLYQSSGINVDAELALFQADHQRDLKGSLEAARRAISNRGSVVTADVLAWTLYQNGEFDEALVYSRLADRLGTRSALFAFHEGMIEYRLGHRDAAKAALERSLAINPYFSPIHASEARAVLNSLNNSPEQAGRESTPTVVSK